MADVTIQVLANGPLLVGGPIKVTDAAGKEIPVVKSPTALCRCGHSKNKPFCDGSHRTAGFQG